MAKTRIALPGSAKVAVAGAKAAGAADPSEQIEVTVRVRGRNPKGASDEQVMKLGAMPPGKRPILDRNEFAAKYGADQVDLDRVAAFAHEHGFAVTHASAGQKMLRLRGTVASFNEAFGVKLKTYKKARALT